MSIVFETADVESLVSADNELAVARRFLNDAALVGPDQHEVRDQILEFCDANHDALHRTCLTGHLTGSAIVVSASGGQVLLIHHKKLHRWLQPGGHADGDGNLALVALKEASEETGIVGLQVVTTAIDLDIHSIPERGDEPTHLHHDVRFVVLAPPEAEVIPNHETNGAAWIDAVDDAGLMESDELRRLVSRGLEVAAQARAASNAD